MVAGAILVKHRQLERAGWNVYEHGPGFLKYMPWNSQRLIVDEDQVRKNHRILAFVTTRRKLVIVLSNRGHVPLTYHIETRIKGALTVHRYAVAERDAPLDALSGGTISPMHPPQSVEFWVQK